MGAVCKSLFSQIVFLKNWQQVSKHTLRQLWKSEKFLKLPISAAISSPKPILFRYNFGRVPMGGTDFSPRPYTYNDLEDNETDVDLKKFSLQKEDLEYKIPFLKRALEINPELKLYAVPWSAPPWMKSNKKFTGIGNCSFTMQQIYTI